MGLLCAQAWSLQTEMENGFGECLSLYTCISFICILHGAKPTHLQLGLAWMGLHCMGTEYKMDEETGNLRAFV